MLFTIANTTRTGPDVTSELIGGCLCGRVRYVVEGGIPDVSHCHCAMCRKAHGAAFATYANVAAAAHRFVQGEEHLRVFRSSPQVERLFCGECGSPMAWRNAAAFPGETSFPLGSLDTPFVPRAQRHIFVGSKAPWDEIRDDWPRSE
jgi:hypothetical protein